MPRMLTRGVVIDGVTYDPRDTASLQALAGKDATARAHRKALTERGFLVAPEAKPEPALLPDDEEPVRPATTEPVEDDATGDGDEDETSDEPPAAGLQLGGDSPPAGAFQGRKTRRS